MSDLFGSQLDDACGLLLRPTAENVSHAAARLECAAEGVAQVRNSWMSGEIDTATALELLTAVRAKALRARDLLNSAARLYNALNTTSDVASYERHGCVCMLEMPRRPLAQM